MGTGADATGRAPARWDQAMAARPVTPPYLDGKAIATKCAAAGVPPERIGPLKAVVSSIRSDPRLGGLAWYLYWRTLVLGEYIPDAELPALDPGLGERNGLFFLLLALEAPRRLAETYRELDVPRTVLEDTGRIVGCEDALRAFGGGPPGIPLDEYRRFAAWIQAANPHLRVGRFEFGLRTEWGEYFAVYRRRRDGATLALVHGGLRIDAEGLLLDESDTATPGWGTRWEETAGDLVAHPIHPAGRVLEATVRIVKDEWRRVPAPTGPDPFDSEGRLDVHVPFGGGLDWEGAVASLRSAVACFGRLGPDRPARILTMNSWLLDPRLPDVLGPVANIAVFQSAVHLAPDPPNPNLLHAMIFAGPAAPADLPERTSVQRAIKRFLVGGGSWHGGAMFVLPEDLPDLRPGFYLERFAALEREFGLEP